MNRYAIQAERLGKKYRLRHQQTSYRSSFREAISTTASTLFSGIFRKRPSAALPSAEDFWALRDVSFEIKSGEVVGIIGRNGAGKSTLLKILSRITKPTEGQARIGGRSASLLEVGTGFHPELTGRENIFLNGAILGMTRAEINARFDEIVSFADVEKFLDTPVKHYSSGMYVRLAFAVAAHLNPEILIIDEVLAVGDAGFQRKCLGKMRDAARIGRTVLFVSHNMGAIRSLCTEAIWLDRGRITDRGTPSQIIDSYLRESLDNTGSRFDLSRIRRQGGLGERLEILLIEFNDGQHLIHGEPLTVRIEYSCKADVYDVSIGFGFATLDGTRLMTVDSDLNGERRDIPASGRQCATIYSDELLLQPGRYSLDVGARSGDLNALDYLGACAEVEVLPGPKTPGAIIRDSGGVRIPAVWKW